MKNYLVGLDLEVVTQNEVLIQVLQGELKVVEGTHIHNESLILKSFLSSVVIQDSRISEITYFESPINAITTTVEMKNVTVENILLGDFGSQISFIEMNSGTLIADGVVFQNGQTRMIQLLFSIGVLENLQFINIHSITDILSTLNSESLLVKNFEFTNSTVEMISFVNLKDSQDIKVEDTTLQDLQYRLISFENSNITHIKNISITNSTQVFIFSHSKILKISNSTFIDNSLPSPLKGGAVKIQNSQVTLDTCTFTRNSAYAGGAITFECTTMQL